MIPVQRLNHAVLYVRDAAASAQWYSEVFGFGLISEIPGVAAFLRAAGTENHHDLGLFTVGADAPGPERGRVGLYHLAWQVGSVTDLDVLGAVEQGSTHAALLSIGLVSSGPANHVSPVRGRPRRKGYWQGLPPLLASP